MPAWLSERARNGGVDEIPLRGMPGRLLLCGKHFVAPDPDAALARVGADTVVCLCEPAELGERYPGYVAWLRAAGPDRALWHAVPDLHAPARAEADGLLADLAGRLDAGRGLLLHCGAGIGRAGTLAAALLVRAGWDVASAVAHVRAHRPLAGPEVGAQTRLLEDLARR